MYTITRKLAMVCLAVVFSVLVYGCGGGGSDQATMTPDGTDGTDGTDGMAMTHPVSTEMVTAGLTIMPGTYPILPGETADAGDATFTCAEDGPSCDVTVDDDGNATSTGGMATAMNSAAADERLAEEARLEVERLAEEARLEVERLAEVERQRILAVENTVDTSTVTAGLIITAGTFTLQPGESRNQYDATFTCPADGVRCVVTVDDEGTAMSVGGAATAMNSDAGNNKLVVENTVDTSDVTVGLTIEPGMYTIDPGGSMDAGDATFTCSAGGVPCVVTVADDGTATSAGGTAMAMNSDAGNAKRDAPSDVDTGMVTVGLEITAGTYTIQPGESENAGDATFTCSELGAPCVVTVADDGTVTSAGGMATAMNSSDGNLKVYASEKVDTSEVLAGLIIKPGMYTILPGEDMDLFDANFECPEGGLPCVVRVDLNADGTTSVTSAGGLATATLSASADMKLGETGSVDMSTVTAGLTDVTAGEYPLPPGGNMDAGEVTFTCPVGGVRCVVTVTVTDDLDEDGEKTGTTTTTVTFLGGMAMASDSAAGKAKLAVSTVVADTSDD